MTSRSIPPSLPHLPRLVSWLPFAQLLCNKFCTSSSYEVDLYYHFDRFPTNLAEKNFSQGGEMKFRVFGVTKIETPTATTQHYIPVRDAGLEGVEIWHCKMIPGRSFPDDEPRG